MNAEARAIAIWQRMADDQVSKTEARRRVDADLRALIAAFAPALTEWLEQLRAVIQAWWDAIRPIIAQAYQDAQLAGLVPASKATAPRCGPPPRRLDGRRR